MFDTTEQEKRRKKNILFWVISMLRQMMMMMMHWSKQLRYKFRWQEISLSLNRDKNILFIKLFRNNFWRAINLEQWQSTTLIEMTNNAGKYETISSESEPPRLHQKEKKRKKKKENKKKTHTNVLILWFCLEKRRETQ